ncbi:MAG TPA: sulfatase-like hydrolase/transferase [Gaiellaceae bacterium]|nr:sulfatase-like hydrolase/transferase [Gaiellaceae bacterium]
MRSSRLIAVAVLLGAAAVSAGAVRSPAAATKPAARPNVVVLMTDDQTVESLRVMPNVKRLLVDRGTTFDSSFVSFPLCCPSRATFLTGQYAHNHGVLANHPPFGHTALDHSNTLPVWLQRAGYLTGHVGKYLNGYGDRDRQEVPPGWTEWHAAPADSAFRYYDYTLNENGRLVEYGSGPGAYQTDVYARKAVELVSRWAPGKQPFFLSVAFLAPHSGGARPSGRPGAAAVPAPRHSVRFAREGLPMPPSFNEADVSDKPSFVRSLPRLSPLGVDDATERYRLRLASLLAVDDALAAIAAELARHGELDETLIVFTSDNGFFHGEHRIPSGKNYIYDPAIRVPLVMRGPGVPAGLRLRQQVANVDLAPTIVAASGAKPGRVMDGRSLWPLLRDPGIFWGRDLLLESAPPAGRSLAAVAVRTPKWMYAQYFTGEAELYDLSKDPYELRSLHANVTAARIRGDLADRLSRLRSCVGADCRVGVAVTTKVRVTGACPVAGAEVEVVGPDADTVDRVRFLVNGRELATDDAAPFRLVLPLRMRPSYVRAHSVLVDGREVTRDRRLPGCARA